MTTEIVYELQEVEGGLGVVQGLQVTGISAGFRRNPQRRDLALIVAPPQSTAAGVFTQSNFAAAPVLLSKRHLAAQAEAQTQTQTTDTSKNASGCVKEPFSQVILSEAKDLSLDGDAELLVKDPSPTAQNDRAERIEDRVGEVPHGIVGFRALVINSGNANAATGNPGMQTAESVCALTAQLLDSAPEEVLVASTGVIGAQLAFERFESGLPQAFAALESASAEDKTHSGIAVAEAIMTTDTFPKVAARSFRAKAQDGSEVVYTVGGMAKGSGMIAPHMATMIAVLATDARIEQPALQQLLKEVVDVSFNKVTIDSDTSTNDSAYLIATGVATGELLQSTAPAFASLKSALIEVCQDLTYQIAKDGEGATKVVVVDVTGAASEDDADKVARAIADSPLVKTAIAGHDANWGRIAMAAGKAGASFKQEDVSISIMDMEVLVKGSPVAFSEEEALKRFSERDEVHIVVDLGAGSAHTRIWTCDLTKEYVAINGDYRT